MAVTLDAEAKPRVALVVGTASGGMGIHVRMLATGLAGRGNAVSLFSPASTAADLGYTSIPGVEFTPLELGSRPRLRDALTVRHWGRSLSGFDVVHAHGLRAGAFATLAVARVRDGRRPGLVVTVHNAPPVGRGAPIYRALQRYVARRADLVLCVSGDLEQRMRGAGARRVGHAVVPVPGASGGLAGESSSRSVGSGPRADRPGGGYPAADRAVAGRPVVLAVGRLATQKGFGTLLRAAKDWQDMDPRPRVVIAGAGPLDQELRRQARELGADAEFLGRRDDVPSLLASASVFVLPSVWEGQPLILQEALRAGVPIVASRAGGIPDLTGEDAAVLVPPGEPAPLAVAVRDVLEDPARAGRLRAAARARAAVLPTEEDAVTAATEAYATVLE